MPDHRITMPVCHWRGQEPPLPGARLVKPAEGRMASQWEIDITPEEVLELSKTYDIMLKTRDLETVLCVDKQGWRFGQR